MFVVKRQISKYERMIQSVVCDLESHLYFKIAHIATSIGMLNTLLAMSQILLNAKADSIGLYRMRWRAGVTPQDSRQIESIRHHEQTDRTIYPRLFDRCDASRQPSQAPHSFLSDALVPHNRDYSLLANPIFRKDN